MGSRGIWPPSPAERQGRWTSPPPDLILHRKDIAMKHSDLAERQQLAREGEVAPLARQGVGIARSIFAAPGDEAGEILVRAELE